MYFRGKAGLDKEFVYSSDLTDNTCRATLTDEMTGARYSVSYNKLDVSFDGGDTWIEYNKLKGLV